MTTPPIWRNFISGGRKMVKKIADIKAKVGEYTNKNGETKGRWIDVGYVLELDKGGKMRCYYPWINLSGIPKKDGHDSVVLSEFDVKDNVSPDTHKVFDKQGDVASSNPTTEDEIPF